MKRPCSLASSVLALPSLGSSSLVLCLLDVHPPSARIPLVLLRLALRLLASLLVFVLVRRVLRVGGTKAVLSEKKRSLWLPWETLPSVNTLAESFPITLNGPCAPLMREWHVYRGGRGVGFNLSTSGPEAVLATKPRCRLREERTLGVSGASSGRAQMLLHQRCLHCPMLAVPMSRRRAESGAGEGRVATSPMTNNVTIRSPSHPLPPTPAPASASPIPRSRYAPMPIAVLYIPRPTPLLIYRAPSGAPALAVRTRA
ncbi:hypothetical protein C8R45DRAFT_1104697 [Mycena sanguinolenta]|nr:hypothetical protein C8R45DRAFT_1104697 [Mycena sanguinolenta]